LGGKAKRFADILGFEIGISVKYLLHLHAVGDHADHRGNRNAQTSDTSHSVHLFWINSDSFEFHCLPPEQAKMVRPALSRIFSGTTISLTANFILGAARAKRRAVL